ncbi:MAG: SDR family NAD(P)-dependent oxidoreductase, partial [Methanobacteriaceae archaeon]|nr:SDR family NAD(P)-dependent oxidoreductase [Methanobacteriaceae archaeon]
MKDIKVYDGKCVLVTGGAGCIGSNLSRRLGEAGAHVIILDNLSSGYEWNIPLMENIEFIKGDILDDEILKRVYK